MHTTQVLTLLLDEFGARELNAWEPSAQQSVCTVADALAACSAADAQRGGGDTPGACAAGRPLADVLRVALSSLGPWPGEPGGQPGGGKGSKEGLTARPRLALAELVGLARRARIVVLRPADPNPSALSGSGEPLLSELESAAERALDAGAQDASTSGQTGLPRAWGARGPQNWGRCDLVVLEVQGRGATNPGAVYPAVPAAHDRADGADASGEAPPTPRDVPLSEPHKPGAFSGAAAAAGWRGGRWLSAALWRLGHDDAAALLPHAARLHLGVTPTPAFYSMHGDRFMTNPGCEIVTNFSTQGLGQCNEVAAASACHACNSAT